ncbi:hypothetical protein [Loktanella sp. SALINAS62]|nr:hypothetical protein [Loktanella sp. SALINAS62]MBS1300954.1 hypothetical protein [Loktanella sp. SALINAS62]
MKGFVIGTLGAVILSGLTYLAMQAGTLTMAERYSPPTIIVYETENFAVE